MFLFFVGRSVPFTRNVTSQRRLRIIRVFLKSVGVSQFVGNHPLHATSTSYKAFLNMDRHEDIEPQGAFANHAP